MLRRAGLGLAVAGVASTGACSRGPAGMDRCATPVPLATFTVSPSQLNVAPGGRGTVVAVVSVDPRCAMRPQVGWRMADTTVARVERGTGTSTTVLDVRPAPRA